MVQFGNKNWHFSCCKGPTKWILRSKRKWEVKQTDGEHRWMCLQGTPLVSKGRNGWLGIQRTNTSSIITEREGRWKCKVWRWVAGKWCYLAKTIKVFSPESHQLTPGVCQTQVTCSYETIWHCRTAHTFDIFSKINLFFLFRAVLCGTQESWFTDWRAKLCPLHWERSPNRPPGRSLRSTLFNSNFGQYSDKLKKDLNSIKIQVFSLLYIRLKNWNFAKWWDMYLHGTTIKSFQLCSGCKNCELNSAPHPTRKYLFHNKCWNIPSSNFSTSKL